VTKCEKFWKLENQLKTNMNGIERIRRKLELIGRIQFCREIIKRDLRELSDITKDIVRCHLCKVDHIAESEDEIRCRGRKMKYEESTKSCDCTYCLGKYTFSTDYAGFWKEEQGSEKVIGEIIKKLGNDEIKVSKN
jgi:hypothetical protein